MPESELFETSVDFDEYHRLREIERLATGLVRTAHVDVGRHEVVRQWWDALADAVADSREIPL